MYVLMQAYALFWTEGWLDLIDASAGITCNFFEGSFSLNGQAGTIPEAVGSTYSTLYPVSNASFIISYARGRSKPRTPKLGLIVSALPVSLL